MGERGSGRRFKKKQKNKTPFCQKNNRQNLGSKKHISNSKIVDLILLSLNSNVSTSMRRYIKSVITINISHCDVL